MTQFRPQFMLKKTDYNKHMFSLNSYDKSPHIKQVDEEYIEYEYHGYKIFTFPTITKLTKHKREIMSNHNANEITVIRSRRGEWGEWFEVWKKYGNKTKKIEEGWM